MITFWVRCKIKLALKHNSRFKNVFNFTINGDIKLLQPYLKSTLQ